MNTLPCISLWQPWAGLLVHGHEHPNGKRVENRTWDLPATMRGRWCLVHAAKTNRREEFDAAEQILFDIPDIHLDYSEIYDPPREQRRLFGGIIGAVKLPQT